MFLASDLRPRGTGVASLAGGGFVDTWEAYAGTVASRLAGGQGVAFRGSAGVLHCCVGRIEGDVNGNRAAGLVIRMDDAEQLNANDVVLWARAVA